MVNGLISLINIMVLVFFITATCALMRASPKEVPAVGLIAIMAIATLIGVVNAWFPPMVALREVFTPAQPITVLFMVTIFLLVGFSAAGRFYFQGASLPPLIALHGWRVLFGSLLLIVGLQGGLPADFFWSVAIGDIIVGLWALSIWRRHKPASHTELKLWSAIGLADLLHVLPRAIITLPPFYATHPDVFQPILLPLLGVPMLIALHILLLRRIFGDGQSNERDAPPQTR